MSYQPKQQQPPHDVVYGLDGRPRPPVSLEALLDELAGLERDRA